MNNGGAERLNVPTKIKSISKSQRETAAIRRKERRDMKAYLITSGEYSDYCVHHITLSKEKAELFCEVHNHGRYYDYQIEEFEIDDFKIEKKQRYLYEATKWLRDGSIEVEYVESQLVENDGYINHERAVFYVEAKDVKHAEKVAQDKWAEIEYRIQMGELPEPYKEEK